MFNIGFALIAAILFSVITLKTKSYTSTKKPYALEPYEGIFSVIIPARDEEMRLEGILSSLCANNDSDFEIIVVNDMSTDNTSLVAQKYGVRLIEISELKHGFAGKTNACDVGVQASKGELIVFLDADTNVAHNFVSTIREMFSNEETKVVTLQPKHKMKSTFEQFSLFFHISAISATGIFSCRTFGFGLYGPCIAMTKSVYFETEGFANKSVRSSIVEDVALSRVIEKSEINIDRYIGNDLIEYKMYDNLKDLFLGWKRNISAGFRYAPNLPSLILVLFYGSLISVLVELFINQSYTSVFVAIFILQYILIINVALKLGNYVIGAVLYPFTLLFFMVVFFASAFTYIFKLNTTWAGRKIKVAEK